MDLSVAVVRAQIPASEAARVRTGQLCAFVPADAPDASFAGRVSVVNQSIDTARRTVESWCEVPNLNRQLLAGAFGQVSIVTGVTPKGVVVPIAAVQFTEGSSKGIVMLASDDGVAVKREVITGGVFDGKVHITSGLESGERVIVQGAYGLQEGMRIRVQKGNGP
jgi:RND family efflux transporter MFP subunit